MEHHFRSVVYGLGALFLVGLPSNKCCGTEIFWNGIINTTYGPVQGQNLRFPSRNKELVQYLGIPYANASRFEAPEPPTTWFNETFQATKNGKSCPQVTNKPPYYIKPDSISEDCLNLNVFAPNTTKFQNRSASYPVMVWVHGGAMIYGSGALYDASILSTEGEIVVVTINYRLGALGFLSTGDDELKGNMAVLDVIQSLKWVNDNIVSFGGDPENITLAGWSAGARLVSMVILSPQASGLYHRVILMSGEAGSIFSYLTPKEARERAEYYGALVRCPYPSSDFVDCLKRKSIEELVDAQAKTVPGAFMASWAPVIDGHLIPGIPADLFKEGRFNATDVLMGVASSDGSAFLDDLPGINEGIDVSKGISRAVFNETVHQKTWIRHQDRKMPNMAVFEYTDWTKPDDENKTRDEYLNMITDAVYRAPAIESANAFTSKGARVFFYQTEFRDNNDADGNPYPTWMGVPHGYELRHLFPNATITVISQQTRSFMDYWINFIKTGTPNVRGSDQWPLYTLAEGNYLALQRFVNPLKQLRVQKMAFWNDFMPANGVREERPRPTAPPEKDMDDVTIALIVVSILLGIALIIIIILAVLMMRGGGAGSSGDKRQPARPAAQTYSTQSKKPIMYSAEKPVSPPTYEDRTYSRYPRDERDYPSYPMDNEKSYPRYPDEEKSYPRYPDHPDNYPSYNDHDGSYYQDDFRGSKSDMDHPDKFMDSDML